MLESPAALANVTFGRVAPMICVRDLTVAEAFYVGVLGFAKTFENGNPVIFMVLKKDAAEIHLTEQRDHQPSNVNVAHMFVDDIAAVSEACVAAGVRIVKPLADKSCGQRAFVLADPDGNRIDIAERRS